MTMKYSSGRQFVQIPGPTNVPDRVLRAIARPTIDHRSPEFSRLGREVLEDMKEIFKTSSEVIIFPSSGTGAWEASLVNTLSSGDKVLMFEIGHFSGLWGQVASKLDLDVHVAQDDWRRGVAPQVVEAELSKHREPQIKSDRVVDHE